MNSRQLAALYGKAHDTMRNLDGLQPQEAFDELLKFLFFRERTEELGSLPGDAPFRLSSLELSVDLPRMRAIRAQFRKAVRGSASAAAHLWSDGEFRLTDNCLSRIDGLFSGVEFRAVPFDMRSAALREFLPSDIRRGLGIYLTPDEVVRAVVEIVQPRPEQRVLDPACGSGTFLVEVLKHWRTTNTNGNPVRRVFGIDRNPRMLLLAGLNLMDEDGIQFNGMLVDSLSPTVTDDASKSLLRAGGYDVILTNPPFGVYVDNTSPGFLSFGSCRQLDGKPIARQQSEVLFLEQCFRLLRDGGELAIVLPRSVITNTSDRLDSARRAINELGFVHALLELPPETFYTTGTQTNTVVLFARKFARNEDRASPIAIPIVTVTNVGYDSTGRSRANSDLPGAITALRHVALNVANDRVVRLPAVAKSSSFSQLPNLVAHRGQHGASTSNSRRLADLVELVTTGRTPARSAYVDEGLFLVKVGNLTGSGINWQPRDRNFVGTGERLKRERVGLLLRKGDIVLTSSAHSPVYIGKKSDVITLVPDWVGGEASFVGEVMLIRPKLDLIDPIMLLAFLRADKTIERLQQMVRGQTAHLHPDDVKELVVPNSLFEPTPNLIQLKGLLERETELAEHQNQLAFDQARLLSTEFGPSPALA